ncbi:hypothetical protein TNCV_1935811 [Trichonephila clavipes]|nr:hypothetical protein TNCV_1935811 [Trichonephila clavipes]
MSDILCSPSTPPPTMEPNKGRQPSGHLTCVRHGTYLRGGTKFEGNIKIYSGSFDDEPCNGWPMPSISVRGSEGR